MTIGPYSPDYKVRAHIDAELPPDIDALTGRVDDLETSVGSVDVTARDADLAQAELDVIDAQTDATQALADAATAQAAVDAVELADAIVAGPTTLTNHLYLTAQLLRKTLTVAAGPNASTVNTAHGITTPTKILGVQIQLTNGTNHLAFSQGGMLADTIAHSILVAIDGTNVGLTSGAGGDYSLYAGSIVLIYVD